MTMTVPESQPTAEHSHAGAVVLPPGSLPHPLAIRRDIPVRPRVVIADAQALVAEGLAMLLAPDFDVVGRVSDGPSLLEVVRRRRPDVAIVDVTMPLLNGLDAARQAKQIDPSLKVVIVTANEDPRLAARAIRSIASAFILKRCPATELVTAIREVLQRHTYVTPLIADRMVESALHSVADDALERQLTIRQRQVLQLLAEGKSMKQAAQLLGITPRTVAFHKYRMMDQLHVTTNAELIKVAFQDHVI
jgi:DNA-binding NarL/FixJ family response regulator